MWFWIGCLTGALILSGIMATLDHFGLLSGHSGCPGGDWCPWKVHRDEEQGLCWQERHCNKCGYCEQEELSW